MGSKTAVHARRHKITEPEAGRINENFSEQKLTDFWKL